MSPFVRHYISHSTLKALVKTSYNFDIDLDKVRGDLGKVSSKVNAYVRDAISGPNYTIPPVQEESSNTAGQAPVSPAVDKRKGRGPLTDLEIEDAIGDLFDYFNDTFGTLKENLSQEGETCPGVESCCGHAHMVLYCTRSLGPGDRSTLERNPDNNRRLDCPAHVRSTHRQEDAERKRSRHRIQVAGREYEHCVQWIHQRRTRLNRSTQFLVNFFHGQGDGVPLEDLRNAKYRGESGRRLRQASSVLLTFLPWRVTELVEARMYYDWSTDQLMEESVRTSENTVIVGAHHCGSSSIFSCSATTNAQQE